MASEEKQGEEMVLLILACPTIAERKVQMTSIPSADTADAEKTISESVREKSRKTHDREERNWFLKMFTW